MITINIPIFGTHKTEVVDGTYTVNEFRKLYEMGNPNHHITFFTFNTRNFIKAAKEYYKTNHITYKTEYDDRYDEYLYYMLNDLYDELFDDKKEYAAMKKEGDIQYAYIK